MFNLTLVGDPSQEFGPESTNCMRLRVGTAGIVRNFICTGFKSQAIDVRDAPATQLINEGRLRTTHGILFQNGSMPAPFCIPLTKYQRIICQVQC